MYTVERIEENIVVLENRDTKEIINVNINYFDINIKLNDIVIYDYEDNIYKKNKEETEYIKNNIRNRFDRLKR